MASKTVRHRHEPKEGKTIKAAKAPKRTKLTTSTSKGSSPPSSLHELTVTDQTLAFLVRTGALHKSYEMKHMKVMLAERQLKVSGKKNELIERLENYLEGLNKVQEPPAPPVIPLGIPEG